MIMKKTILLSMTVFALGCQTLTQRGSTSPQDSTPVSGSQDSRTSEPPPPPIEPVTPTAPKSNYKVGIILGPGGAKTFSQVGFLKQLQMKRVPVHAIVGIEWGSLVAASFAAKGSAHETEWQLSKMKGLDKGWFSDGAADVKKVLDPIGSYLSSYKAESMKLPFGCPSLNIKKSQVYMMARGRLDQLLPFCLAYPPTFKSHERTIAGVREINSAVDYLRSQGANYIILVNVLSQLDQDAPINWHEISYDMKRKWPGVHERLDLQMGSKKLNDFNSRQEMIESGMEQSAGFVERLANKL